MKRKTLNDDDRRILAAVAMDLIDCTVWRNHETGEVHWVYTLGDRDVTLRYEWLEHSGYISFKGVIE